MASFYNPYSPNPDIGGGISDLIHQFIQIMMMKKIMSGQGQQEQSPQEEGWRTTTELPTQLPPANRLPPLPPSMGAGMNAGISGGQGLPPQLLQMLMTLMRQRRQ